MYLLYPSHPPAFVIETPTGEFLALPGLCGVEVLPVPLFVFLTAAVQYSPPSIPFFFFYNTYCPAFCIFRRLK